MEKRTDDDIQITLSIPEHKFKKISEKFNWVIKKVYDNHAREDVKMFHILLSLQNYFEMQWLVENVVSEENKSIITKEMQEEYNITVPKKEEAISDDKTEEK